LLPTGTLRPGIGHIGLGAVARAHTALFTENAMLATGSSDWKSLE
jgi:fructuronate reductase